MHTLKRPAFEYDVMLMGTVSFWSGSGSGRVQVSIIYNQCVVVNESNNPTRETAPVPREATVHRCGEPIDVHSTAAGKLSNRDTIQLKTSRSQVVILKYKLKITDLF